MLINALFSVANPNPTSSGMTDRSPANLYGARWQSQRLLGYVLILLPLEDNINLGQDEWARVNKQAMIINIIIKLQ